MKEIDISTSATECFVFPMNAVLKLRGSNWEYGESLDRSRKPALPFGELSSKMLL